MCSLRGNEEMKTTQSFVRFEPYVVHKRSLTGDSSERVDTRVLQIIYQVQRDDLPLFVGEQLDVFIDAGRGVLRSGACSSSGWRCRGARSDPASRSRLSRPHTRVRQAG